MATRIGQQSNPVKVERIWAKQVDQLAEQTKTVAALLRGASKLPAGQLGVVRGNAEVALEALNKVLEQRFAAPLSNETLAQAQQSLGKLNAANKDLQQIADKADQARVPKGAVMYEPKGWWNTVSQAIDELSREANRTGKPHAYQFNNAYLVANPGQDKDSIYKEWDNAPNKKRDPLKRSASEVQDKLEERIKDEKAAAKITADRPAMAPAKLQQLLVGNGKSDPLGNALDKLNNPKDIKAACRYLVDNAVMLYSKDPDSGKMRTPSQALKLLQDNFKFAVGEWAQRGTEDIWRKEMAAAVQKHRG